MDTPALNEAQPLALTPQQKYRQSEKCKLARERYYNTKGKLKAHEYYERNKETILNRSKERYLQLKTMLIQLEEDNLLENA
jgi:hypothetical protein